MWLEVRDVFQQGLGLNHSDQVDGNKFIDATTRVSPPGKNALRQPVGAMHGTHPCAGVELEKNVSCGDALDGSAGQRSILAESRAGFIPERD